MQACVATEGDAIKVLACANVSEDTQVMTVGCKTRWRTNFLSPYLSDVLM